MHDLVTKSYLRKADERPHGNIWFVTLWAVSPN